MTALLTDNLPLLAGAPNGIKKLRELILELAVRGKLVPQDPSDEPASELLKQIAEEKARLVAEGKIKKQKPLAEIAEEEWPFVLPVGWKWSRLGDVSEYIQRGKGPVYVDQSSFKVVSQKCVRWTGLDLEPARFIAPESLVKYESIRFLRSGDILWNSTGTGTIGRACVVEDCSEDEQLVADSHVTVVRPTGLLSVFLWRWIQSPSVQSELEGNASGTTNQIELNTSTVIAHLTPIPPLAEQHRIVAKVDELMALCDRLEARQADAENAHAQLVQALLDSLTQARDSEDFAQSWQRLAEHFHTLFTTESSIDALKQTLLQLAVMGKLVPQDPNDEPASDLLKRIADAKVQAASQGRGRKVKTATDYRASDTEVTVPAGWSLSTVGEVTICRDGERIPVSQAEREGRAKTYDYYGASGVIDKIDGYLFDKPLLLVGEDGANLINRSTPIAFMARGKYWVNNHAHVLDGVSEALLLYVQLYFNAIDLKPYVTGTAQPKMNQAKMNSIVLLLPPEAEQHRIVAKVDQLMALCDQLKARLNQARQVHEQLANALVEQAVA